MNRLQRRWFPRSRRDNHCCQIREGVEPSGSQQKVSDHSSSFSGFILAQGKFHDVPSINHSRNVSDHLVGGGQQRIRDGEPESLGGLAIDHQLELGWKLDGQLADLCTTEDAVDKRGSTPP